jgi:hypothetical protein
MNMFAVLRLLLIYLQNIFREFMLMMSRLHRYMNMNTFWFSLRNALMNLNLKKRSSPDRISPSIVLGVKAPPTFIFNPLLAAGAFLTIWKRLKVYKKYKKYYLLYNVFYTCQIKTMHIVEQTTYLILLEQINMQICLQRKFHSS